MKLTKMEVNCLTNIDVFEKAYDSKWAAPSFVKQKFCEAKENGRHTNPNGFSWLK
jgi:hypothetical protein